MSFLEGKVAVVTGGNRGIGRGISEALHSEGATVVLTARDAAAATRAAGEIGARATGLACDVRDEASVGRLFAEVEKRHGGCDVLVNNAGMSPVYPRPVDVSEDLFDKVIGVNLKGPFRLTAIVGERMMESDGGSIINISSTASERPGANVIPYAAAKAGVNAMTEAFAHAFGPKVRVNCIMPGPFLTDISKAWDMAAFEQQARRFDLRRGGDPEEIVGAALYFATDASSYTTGAILRIDGGSGM